MAAPAGIYNITADQGATFSRQLTWKDSTGAVVNLTGYTARMQLRSNVEATGSAVLSLTTENNRIVLGGTAGTIALGVAASAMEAVGAATYVYDLELVSGSVVTRLVQGTFEIRAEVTR
jgi:hypothetical protein